MPSAWYSFTAPSSSTRSMFAISGTATPSSVTDGWLFALSSRDSRVFFCSWILP